jgi:hypothetical protein
MNKAKLLKLINQIAQLVIENCETDKEIEQVKEGIEKYIDFSKSISQI